MGARPKVHSTEAARAIERIARRRTKVDDPFRDRLPDAPDSDPREVLDYLLRYSHADHIPRWVLQADVSDALILSNFLWWEDKRRELQILKAGRDRGLFLSQLGSQVGVGKQGVLDRIDRLQALLEFDRPDEKISRAARRAHRDAERLRTVQQHWLDAHQAEVVDVIEGLICQADRYQLDAETREWLDELADDIHHDVPLSPPSMAVLGLAIADLRVAPAILAIDSSRPSKVHALLVRADALRSRFAALSDRQRE